MLAGLALIAWMFIPDSRAQVITNLQQLAEAVSTQPQARASVDLEATVCAASRPNIGVLIVQDQTGAELLQVGRFPHEVRPGTRVRFRHDSALVRRREMGIQLSAVPLINNDGLHSLTSVTATVELPKGRVPILLEWFNYWRTFALDVFHGPAGEQPRMIAASNLWHAVISESGETNFLPGLRAEMYEGSWDHVPDFNVLSRVDSVVATNFAVIYRSRNERFGIRFSGYLDVPHAGPYRFVVGSDDGSLLFLGDPHILVEAAGHRVAPDPETAEVLGTPFDHPEERRWVVVEGRASFVSRVGEGMRFDLGTGHRTIPVRVADADGLDPASLMNSRVRIAGLGRASMTLTKAVVLGRLAAASAQDVVFLERRDSRSDSKAPITSVAQVQGLPIEEARRALPVRIRGTVTDSTKTTQEHWMSFQDDTRGIFVTLAAISNSTPAFGEFWEVEGRSAAGNFAPVVVAERVTRIGAGLLPVPVQPTWTELLNGSRDVQWAELRGLVTGVESNTISLQMPEGLLEVELEGGFESELRSFLNNVVRIRGVLYAVWDASTREVRVGRVMMRNSTISVDVPASADPFEAVVRTPRELLLFDALASAFRPVKVRGQVVYSDAQQVFIDADGTGLRLLPSVPADLRPGDLVDAVGFPDIRRAELLLRQTLFRKTGEAPMPEPRRVDETQLTSAKLHSTRVRIQGNLLGWHGEHGSLVLEMQTGSRLYLARIASGEIGSTPLRTGSRLALDGVYVGRAPERPTPGNESFELLLNSLADVTILTQPPWWTLPRLLALVGILAVILAFTIIWNTQLRRLVEQRTNQLQREIRERERVERRAALESERSRIARDLHDDLGSSLTEISVLASTGQLPNADHTGHSKLFHAISNRARNLISALDVIVWAVDPEDNSLQSLADYLTGYTNEFFAHTQIACRFKVPVSCPAITLEGRVRHDLFMAVKEALNNVVRHADATELEFRLNVSHGTLEIDISDNGKGIEPSAPGGGHGLRNLSARLTKQGGSCAVEPLPGGGTIVKIRLPLPTAADVTPLQPSPT